MTITLGIDPGETTGLALRRDDGTIAVSMTRSREHLWSIFKDIRSDDYVCIEDFVTSGRISKHGLYTVRLVGSIEVLSWQKGLDVQRQVPSFRMAFLSRAAKLLQGSVGLDHEHRHEKDALAHLMAFEDWGTRSGRPKATYDQRIIRTSVEGLSGRV